MELGQIRKLHTGRDFASFGSAPYVLHCHHFNLWWDQCVSDIFADDPAKGFRLRAEAARWAFKPIIEEACSAGAATTQLDKLQIAADIFSQMGHGIIRPAGQSGGGDATGEFLHYGFAWMLKYGERCRCEEKMDAVATGFLAAIHEVVFGEHAWAEEKCCVAQRQEHCSFEVSVGKDPGLSDDYRIGIGPVTASDYERLTPAMECGKNDEAIDAIAEGLRTFLAPLRGDDRGLISGFGILATMHSPSYYNRVCFDSIRHCERERPQLVSTAERLFREGGQACVYHTLGGVMRSPEWEALVGIPSGDPEETLTHAMAICRAFGFGRWVVHEFDPGKRFVMRSAANYETPGYIMAYGESDRPRGLFAQGAAQGLMMLAYGYDWANRPDITREGYLGLCKAGVGWNVKQTKCPTMGDDTLEIVVTKD